MTNHFLFLVGDDFAYYKNGEANFVITEQIFNEFTMRYPNFTWKFSTPSHYLDELESMNLVFPAKFDDFIPFVDRPDVGQYWVGYFSSRPNLKSQIR